MPRRVLYRLTETEFLALELHRNLHGGVTHPDDVVALVEELERRSRRSAGVEAVLSMGRQYLSSGHRQM